MLPDFYVILGTFTYQVNFVVMEIPEDEFYPTIFGRPFFNTAGATLIVRGRLSLSNMGIR